MKSSAEEVVAELEGQLDDMRQRFVGGTLVEYLDGAGMTREFGRGHILDISCTVMPEHMYAGAPWVQVNIETDNEEAFFNGCWNAAAPSSRQIGPFLLFTPIYMPDYLLAPPGVEVPPPGPLAKLLQKIEDGHYAIPDEVH